MASGQHGLRPMTSAFGQSRQESASVVTTTTCNECQQPGLHWSPRYVGEGEGPALLNPDESLHYRRGATHFTCPTRQTTPNKGYSLSGDPARPIVGRTSYLTTDDLAKKLTEIATQANDNARTALMGVGEIGFRVTGISETVAASIAANKATIAEAVAHLEDLRRVELVIKRPELPDVEVKGRMHPKWEKLVTMVSAGENVFICGPAGSGKSYGVEALAEVLDRPMYRYGINMQTSKSDIFGFNNMATGEYIASAAYEATSKPSVLFFDEWDRGIAGMGVMINGIADNGSLTWPNMVTRKRHEQCAIIAAGNTFGRGASAMYNSANQQDAAALDRFSYIRWDYDWTLVHEIVGMERWVDKVQAWSEAAIDLGLHVVIGPRAAIAGAKLIRAGMTEQEAADARVWAPMSEDYKRSIVSTSGVRA